MTDDNKNGEKVFLNDEKKIELLDTEENVIPVNSLREKILRQRGIFYSLLAALFISISGILAKYNRYYNGSEITAIRYFVQLVFMFGVAVIRKENLIGEPDQRRTLILRALFGTIGLLLITISFKLIDPSDTISLVNCSIIIVSVLSRIILHEKYTICHLVALSLTSLGVVMISQPSFLIPKKPKFSNISSSSNQTFLSITNETENEAFTRILGISFALIGAFCAAFVSIILKKLANKKVHFSITIIYASYLGLPVCSAVSFVLLYTGYEKKREIDNFNFFFQTVMAFTAGLSGLFGQIFMNLGFAHEDVTKVSLVRSTDLIFTFIFQYLFLKIHSNLYSIIGAFLILFSVSMVMIYKIMDQKFMKKHKDYLEARKLKKNKTIDNSQIDDKNITKPNLFKKVLFYKF